MGLALTPDRFKCGIDIGGPTDWVAFLEDSPPHWTPLLGELSERIGDPKSAADRERPRTTSPSARAAAIQRPLLVIEGGLRGHTCHRVAIYGAGETARVDVVVVVDLEVDGDVEVRRTTLTTRAAAVL
jgi:hypothetical protein